MPAPFQIFVAAVIGLALTLVAFSPGEPARTPFGRKTWVPLFYQLLIVTPAILYLGVVHTDWTWLYLIDARRLPFGTSVLVVLVAAAAELGGYLAGWALLRARRRRELVGVIGGSAALAFFVSLALHDRLMHAGTYAEYHAGIAAAVGDRKLGLALTVIAAGMIAGLVLSIRFLIEEGAREREG